MSQPYVSSLPITLFIFSLFNTASNLDYYLRVLAPNYHTKFLPLYQKLLQKQSFAVLWVAVNEILMFVHSFILLFGPLRSFFRFIICLQFIGYRYNTSMETKAVFMSFDHFLMRFFTNPSCPKAILNIYLKIKEFLGNYVNVIAGNQ